jgi:hypothetical protein
MEQQEMLRIAKRAIEKKWDFETMKYGDDLYGKEKFADEVWSFVEECEEIGRAAFWAKYPDA